MKFVLSDTAEKRFLEKITILENGCWHWDASDNFSVGYYEKNGMGKLSSPHIASWLIFHGQVENGYFVRQSCKNFSCVNPNHLYLTTNRSITSSQITNPSVVNEKNVHSKLKKDDIINIRNLFQSGKTSAEITEIYNVTQRNIYYIVTGKTWANVGGPIFINNLKISDQLVSVIKKRYEFENISVKDLADEYNISRGHISNIINGRRRRTSTKLNPLKIAKSRVINPKKIKKETSKNKENIEHVYFISSGDLIKIGRTRAKSIEKRVSAVKTSSPIKLKLIGYIKGEIGLEKQLHSKFSQYREKGEWFRAENQLINYINNNAVLV